MFHSSLDVVGERDVQLTRRVLESKFAPPVTTGVWSLYENEWVPNHMVKEGNTFSVVDVNGCSAVYFWDYRKIPSVFHIFCGNEETDGLAAVKQVEDVESVYIATGKQAAYDTLKTLIMAHFPYLEENESFDHRTTTTGQDGIFSRTFITRTTWSQARPIYSMP